MKRNRRLSSGVFLAFLLAGMTIAGEESFEAALRSGDTALCVKWLDKDPDLLRKLDGDDDLPLPKAAHYGHVEIVRILLERGADPEGAGPDGNTPLEMAAHLDGLCKDPARKKAVAEMLLAHGASVQGDPENGVSPMHRAAGTNNWPVLELLLEKGGDAGTRGRDGLTPLHWACHSGSLTTAAKLLASKAEVDPVAEDGATPLAFAVRADHEALVDLLLKHGAKTDFVGNNGYRLSHYAALSGSLKWIRRFPPAKGELETPTANGWTYLHCAAESGSAEAVRHFLELGASIHAEDRNHVTPLLLAIRSCPEEVSLLLLNKGARIDVRDEDSWAPLHCAACMGYAQLMARLLEMKSPVDERSKTGETPLHLACRMGRVEAVDLLLQKGAEVDIVQAMSSTPLHGAAYAGEADVVRHLLEKGAATGIRNLEGHNPADAARQGGHAAIAEMIEAWEKAHPEAARTELPPGVKTAQSRLAALRALQGDRFVLILVPFGEVDRSLLQDLQPRLQRVLGISVLLENLPVDLPKPEEATREADAGRQWNTEVLLSALRTYVGFHGKANIGVIAISGEDLYSPDMNFLFGHAAEGVAVMSYRRFLDPQRPVLLKRALNQALSSTGLLFQIPRCKNPACPRAYPNSLAEHDAKGEVLCQECAEGFTEKFGVAGKPLYAPETKSNESLEVF